MRDPFFDCFLREPRAVDEAERSDSTYRAFYDTCRRFAAKEIAPHAAIWDEAASFPTALYAKAARAGVLGPHLPRDYGGGGGDALHAVIQIEALFEGGNTGVVAGLSSLAIALPPIFALGTDRQKRRFAEPVLAGDKIAALAITEPGTGSDVAAIQTTATRRGSDYVLKGEKCFITSGVNATTVVVLARTSSDPYRGLTFFVVDRDESELAAQPLKKMGWRSSDTAVLTFDNCRVPGDNRLGDEGSGFATAMVNFQMERLILACFGHATAQLVLGEAERYAAERMTFGKPLTEHQVIRHKLARMAMLTRAAKSLNYLVADSMRRGREVTEEVSEAKNFASEVAQEVCNDAVQVFGGLGVMQGSVVERMYRDVRVLPIGGGTTEIMNEVIAKTRLSKGRGR